jgi:hypothetical protein
MGQLDSTAVQPPHLGASRVEALGASPARGAHVPQRHQGDGPVAVHGVGLALFTSCYFAVKTRFD